MARSEAEETGRRRMCQACFKMQAQHQCQACRRFVCDGCRAPPKGPGSYSEESDGSMEDFLQAALVRCRACRDDHVRLPPHDLEFEGG